MRIPKLIYECYPVLYIVMGILAITTVESFVSLLSGIVLALGGIAILFIRRNYRVAKQDIAQFS